MIEETPGYRIAVVRHFEDRYAQGLPALPRAFIEAVRDRLPPSGAHLDLGCGDGALAAALAHLRVTGIDLSESSVKRAKRNAPSARFEVRDATDPPAGPFDSATALSLFNILPEKGAALAAWRRVVRGPLVVADGFSEAHDDRDGAGAMDLRSFERKAEAVGWRLGGSEDLTDAVRAWSARGEWPWPEYARAGFRYLLVELRAP